LKTFKAFFRLLKSNGKVNFLSEQKKITRQELAQNNGKNGKPAYFAFQGKVYEVTDSSFWMEGEHMGMHDAGKDLTEELEMAPHREETFNRIKLVGDLV
jgi:predicted heme/steroid binding protein